jgi:small ligand-binding sensory domain FIST
VFQTDCLLRGRTLFNKVMKDEITAMMQNAFLNGGETPPWLGMYGFGEFCPLGGENLFHTYTTSLLVLYR